MERFPMVKILVQIFGTETLVTDFASLLSRKYIFIAFNLKML